MSVYLNIAQIIMGVALIAIIIFQTRGSGAGSVFGGSQPTVHRTRRGVERTLFVLTVVLSVAFFIVTLISALAAESYR